MKSGEANIILKYFKPTKVQGDLELYLKKASLILNIGNTLKNMK